MIYHKSYIIYDISSMINHRGLLIMHQDQDGTLKSTGYFYLKWRDEYAVWNKIKDFQIYENYVVTLPASKLWSPPMILDNSAFSLQEIELGNNTAIRVNPDGTCEAELSVRLDSSCALDVQRYICNYCINVFDYFINVRYNNYLKYCH